MSTHKGIWGFPKGKVKRNEQLITCAYRELKEETGLIAEQINPINIGNFFVYEVSNKGTPSVKLYLATTDTLIQPKVEDEEELVEAKWVNIEDAYNLLTHKNRKDILQKCVSELSFRENNRKKNKETLEKFIELHGDELHPIILDMLKK